MTILNNCSVVVTAPWAAWLILEMQGMKLELLVCVNGEGKMHFQCFFYDSTHQWCTATFFSYSGSQHDDRPSGYALPQWECFLFQTKHHAYWLRFSSLSENCCLDQVLSGCLPPNFCPDPASLRLYVESQPHCSVGSCDNFSELWSSGTESKFVEDSIKIFLFLRMANTFK